MLQLKKLKCREEGNLIKITEIIHIHYSNQIFNDKNMLSEHDTIFVFMVRWNAHMIFKVLFHFVNFKCIFYISFSFDFFSLSSSFISFLPSYFSFILSCFLEFFLWLFVLLRMKCNHASSRLEVWGLLHLSQSWTMDLHEESMSTLSVHQISYYSSSQDFISGKLLFENSKFILKDCCAGHSKGRINLAFIAPFTSLRAGAYLLFAVSLHPKWLTGCPLVWREKPTTELGDCFWVGSQGGCETYGNKRRTFLCWYCYWHF